MGYNLKGKSGDGDNFDYGNSNRSYSRGTYSQVGSPTLSPSPKKNNSHNFSKKRPRGRPRKIPELSNNVGDDEDADDNDGDGEEEDDDKHKKRPRKKKNEVIDDMRAKSDTIAPTNNILKISKDGRMDQGLTRAERAMVREFNAVVAANENSSEDEDNSDNEINMKIKDSMNMKNNNNRRIATGCSLRNLDAPGSNKKKEVKGKKNRLSLKSTHEI